MRRTLALHIITKTVIKVVDDTQQLQYMCDSSDAG